MPSEVRFTRAQKWDLVRLSAAAVASTVFFTVPMFLVGPAPAPTAMAQAGDVALANSSAPPPIADSASPVVPPTTSASDAVSVVTSTEVASVTTPTLQNPARARSRRPPDLRARANVAPAPASFSRRVVRFLAGTGKYIVKPFPGIGSSGS